MQRSLNLRHALGAVRTWWTRSHERGSVLPAVLVVTAVMSVLLIPLLRLSVDAVRRVQERSDNLSATYAVDAGVEDAIWRLTNDSGFRYDVLSGTPQPYTISVGGETVHVDAGLFSTSGPTPTPAPSPTPRLSFKPIIVSFMDPNRVNLALDPDPVVRVTLIFLNLSGSTSTINTIEEVLPRSWQYAGNLTQTNLKTAAGQSYDVMNLVPAATDCASDAPPCWTYTGNRPSSFFSCQSWNANQTSYVQRLTWDWSSQLENAPRLNPISIAWLSFDVTLGSVPGSGAYTDSPWMKASGQQCYSGQLQAGWAASSILVVYSTDVDVWTDDNAAGATVRVQLGESVPKIEMYSVR